MSINASFGWLRNTASPLWSFYASYLQQKISNHHTTALVSQSSILRPLQEYGTLSRYITSTTNNSNGITVVTFPDARHSSESSHISYIIGIVVCKIQKSSIFNILFYLSHHSPPKSTPVADILVFIYNDCHRWTLVSYRCLQTNYEAQNRIPFRDES